MSEEQERARRKASIAVVIAQERITDLEIALEAVTTHAERLEKDLESCRFGYTQCDKERFEEREKWIKAEARIAVLEEEQSRLSKAYFAEETMYQKKNRELKERIAKLEADMLSLAAELCIDCGDVWFELFGEEE